MAAAVFRREVLALRGWSAEREVCAGTEVGQHERVVMKASVSPKGFWSYPWRHCDKDEM